MEHQLGNWNIDFGVGRFWGWSSAKVRPGTVTNGSGPQATSQPYIVRSPKTTEQVKLTYVRSDIYTPCERVPQPRLGEPKGAPNTFETPAGNPRYRMGFGPKAGPNHSQNIRNGTHKAAHTDSEIFWADFGVFRRRSETFKL